MRQRPIRSMLVLAVAAVAALSVVQLGSARSDRPTAATATTIQVSGKEFFFKLTSKSISRPGRVTFVFKNNGSIQHDFKINGRRTPVIAPRKTARLVVAFKKKGRYPYLCTVPGHAAAGMKGVFTVR